MRRLRPLAIVDRPTVDLPVLVLLVGLMAAATMSSAAATNLLGHRANYQGSIIAFNHVSLTTHMHNATNWNETANLEPTDITRQHNTGYQPSGINVYDSNYGDTWWAARWYCNYMYGGNKCIEGTIQYNEYHINPSATDYHKGVACHEEGHGVGLAHDTNTASCLQTPATEDELSYSNEDVGHIDGLY